MLFSADARQADEGRSFFSKKGGGNRVGEQIVGDEGAASIRTRRIRSRRPCASTARACRSRKNVWVDKGVLKDLFYSRFWAEKMGKEPTAGPANLIMEGGTATMDDLIAGVERGVLVTRFWYIRPLDPQTILVTGLTRDGLFLIEKGKVTRPVKNMRWNESPIVALQQPRRDDAAPSASSAAKGSAASGLVAGLPGRAHPRVHVHELVGRRLTSCGTLKTAGRVYRRGIRAKSRGGL